MKFPNSLRINGAYKKLKFLNKDDSTFFYEFHAICIRDCYHLINLKKKLKNIHTILDIGANQALFTIAARQQFSKATIYCYEPNKKLQKVLDFNASQLGATVYYEAVTKEDCKVQLEYGETDLHTKTKSVPNGEVTGSCFRKVVERAGGVIDLLKLDCEGAEWHLFEDEATWKHIKGLTMEYHLWAKEGSTFDDVKSILDKLNFVILSHEKLSETFGIVTAIKTDQKASR